MPRNVRNFWLELSVDGKRTDVATGPVSKDGGFQLTIKQRDDGGIVRAMTVTGRAREGDDGAFVLELRAEHAGGGTVTYVNEDPALVITTKR